jgi:hypothetical protein
MGLSGARVEKKRGEDCDAMRSDATGNRGWYVTGVGGDVDGETVRGRGVDEVVRCDYKEEFSFG